MIKRVTSRSDLLLTDPKARSGQVRKFKFFDWLDCERITRVLSSARGLACAIHSLQLTLSIQINIFTGKVVFRLKITCKTIFILSVTLSRYQDKEIARYDN